MLARIHDGRTDIVMPFVAAGNAGAQRRPASAQRQPRGAIDHTTASHHDSRRTADAACMRTLPTLTMFLLCAGCGRAPDAAAPAQPAPTSDLAAPVLAPMAARERLLEDLDTQKLQARDRAAQFEAVGADDH